MSAGKMGLIIVLGIICIVLIVVILMQSNRAAGLGAVSAQSSDSYWSKNKGNSLEGTLSRLTKIFGAAFMVIALVINYI
ncbi:MAG: preprotein translocase subunit SecG [Firmicutes bacterium]|nr:preprotein translocase subunit SecG [Bacillota bacterium]